MPRTRTVAAGAGILLLLALSVSALFVGRSIWASNRERPVVVVPKTNPAPVVAEPDRVAIAEKKPEAAPIAETMEEPLPEFKPREATLKTAPVVQRKKAKTVKTENEKPEPVAVLGKTGEPEKTTATVTTRPRIVKVPK
jgi:hypothetical protein